MWGNSSMHGCDGKRELTEAARAQNQRRLLSRLLRACVECILYISHLLHFNSVPLNEAVRF